MPRTWYTHIKRKTNQKSAKKSVKKIKKEDCSASFAVKQGALLCSQFCTVDILFLRKKYYINIF